MTDSPTLRALLAALCFIVSATAQTNVWREFDNTSHGDCAMTFDKERSRFVAVSGGRTLEWDGFDWRRRETATPTPSRLMAHLCYDTVRRRTLLYGGIEHVPLGIPAAVRTLWQYDGHDWIQHPGLGPPARSRPAIAFDSLRGRLVMFGGTFGGFNVTNETWEWDGTSWLLRTPAISPPARDATAMAFHTSSGRMILFGGHDLLGAKLADTWAWDGNNWTQLQPGVVPPARAGHLMSADDHAGTVLLHAGTGSIAILTDSWEWDGTNWTGGTTPHGSVRSDAAMATDATGQTLLLGGVSAQWTGGAYEAASLGDTWAYLGSGAPWVQLTQTGPPYRSSPYFAYDSQRDRLVLAGVSTGTVHHTWEWGNGTWTRMNPVLELPALSGSRMCFDASRGVMVVFGGLLGLSPMSSTYEWDGINWVLRAGNSPPPRWWHAMAYDEARARVVLFGGTLGLADTWTYDGIAWTQAASTGPSTRYLAAMTYDAARAKVVLFGGQDPAGPILGDTWEWDGATWTQRFPAVSPAPRWSAAFAFDRSFNRATLVGGWTTVSPGIAQPVREEWHWDGTNWSGGPADVPVERRGPSIDTQALTYHDGLGALLLVTPAFGANAGVSSDLWIGWPLVAAVQRSGSGCTGTTAPKIGAFGVPVLGDAHFQLEIVAAPANSLVVFGLSTAAGALPLGGGCTLYLQGVGATAAGVANAAGFASVALPIPLNTALIGLTLTGQGAAVDAAAPLGFTLTSQLTLQLGI